MVRIKRSDSLRKELCKSQLVTDLSASSFTFLCNMENWCISSVFLLQIVASPKFFAGIFFISEGYQPDGDVLIWTKRRFSGDCASSWELLEPASIAEFGFVVSQVGKCHMFMEVIFSFLWFDCESTCVFWIGVLLNGG